MKNRKIKQKISDGLEPDNTKYYHDIVWYPYKKGLDQTIRDYFEDIDSIFNLKILHILKEKDDRGQLFYRMILV